jgi:hypothetical protein
MKISRNTQVNFGAKFRIAKFRIHTTMKQFGLGLISVLTVGFARKWPKNLSYEREKFINMLAY